MELAEMEIYRRSREISRLAWSAYSSFDWNTKKTIGDQWIEAVDSVGANIAEGHGRYHYADRNKFNYNARGSLVEAQHWTELLHERGLISDELTQRLLGDIHQLLIALNTVIKQTKEHAQ